MDEYIKKSDLVGQIEKLKVAGVFTEAFKQAVLKIIEYQPVYVHCAERSDEE